MKPILLALILLVAIAAPALGACTVAGPDSICPGGVVQLCATGNAQSWSWTGPGGFTGFTPCVNVAQAGNYHLITMGPGGDQLCDFYLYPKASPPSCSITGPTQACVDQGDLAFSVSVPANGAVQWDVAGGYVQGLASLPTIFVHSGLTPGVSMSVHAHVSTPDGCASDCQQPVNLHSGITVTLDGPATMCPGSLANYTAGSDVSGTIYSWTLAGQGQIVGSNADSSQVQVKAAVGGGSFLLRVDGQAGACIDASPLLTIPIPPRPACQVVGPLAVFSGGANQFTANQQVNNARFQWKVTGNASLEGSTVDNSVIVRAGQQGAYLLSVAVFDTVSGCSTSAAVTVTVGPPAQVTIVGPSAACQSQDSLKYAVQANFPLAQVKWYLGGNGTLLGKGVSPTVYVNAGQPGTFHLQVLAAGTVAFDSAAVTVPVAAPPVCSIVAPDSAYQGEIDTLRVGGTIPSATYLWSVSGGAQILGGAAGPAVVVQAGAGARYSATLLTTVDVCASVCSTTVGVRAAPGLAIQGADTVCAGASILYGAVSQLPGATFAWSALGRAAYNIRTGPSVVAAFPEDAFGTVTLRCVATAQGVSLVATKTVTVAPQIGVAVLGPATLYPGRPATYRIVSNGVPDSIHWIASLVGRASIASGTGPVARFTPPDTGQVSLTAMQDVFTRCESVGTLSPVVRPVPGCTVEGPVVVPAHGLPQVYRVVASSKYDSVTWDVTGNGALLGAASRDSIVVTPGDPGNLRVVATIYTGTAAITWMRCPLDIAVAAPPTCSIQAPARLLDGQDATLTVTGSLPGMTWTWNVQGGVLLGPPAGVSIRVGAAPPGPCRVTVTGISDACTTTCAVTLPVDPAPACAVTGPSTVCPGGGVVTYTALTSQPAPVYAWQVTGNATIVGVADQSQVQVSPTGVGAFDVSAQVGQNTCDLQVAIAPPPTDSILPPGAPPVCSSSGNTLTSQVSPPGATLAYKWKVSSPGGDWVIEGPDYLPQLVYTAGKSGPASFELDVTGWYGCGSAARLPVDIQCQGALEEPPLLSRVAWTVLARGAAVRDTLYGHNFFPDQVLDPGVGRKLTGQTWLDSTRFVFASTVDYDAVLGPRDVQVLGTHSSGALRSAYRIVDFPVITAVVPDTSLPGGLVEIRGHGFSPLGPDSVALDVSNRVAAVPLDSVRARATLPGVLAGPHELMLWAYGAWTASVGIQVLPAGPGDINGDGVVDLRDLGMGAGYIMGRTTLAGSALTAADCNLDGAVNVLDLVCIVDLASAGARGLLAPAGLAIRGEATWNPVTRTLELPAEATAVQWRARPAGAKPGGGPRPAGGWSLPDGGVAGLAALNAGPRAVLPDGAGEPVEVIWSDAHGVAYRATLASPALPATFHALGNPQRGTLWFDVPARRGPATLELIAVTGARVATRALGGSEAGPLAWDLRGVVRAGVYVVRLVSPDGVQTARVVVFP